jgi:hypothetical protein
MVDKFNVYDLYLRAPTPLDAQALRPYYEDLVAKYSIRSGFKTESVPGHLLSCQDTLPLLVQCVKATRRGVNTARRIKSFAVLDGQSPNQLQRF